MSEQKSGTCPGCDGTGELGGACLEKACERLGLHFIPDVHWRAQKSAPADALVGQVIGDFLVVGFVGAGGFGRVYLALQSPIYRLKGALKLLELPSTNAVVVSAMLQKFRQEAEALAELTHPNIVRLLKYGTHKERPYLVMEYIDGGRTLREEIWARARAAGSFSHQELLDILGQVLNALEAAHARGIVHRDIKPENIMLQPVAGHPNHLKILDFGTAKFTEEREDTAWPLGSPSYMAPEQIEMRGIGPWSDLFAVGVLSFELMSGRKPYPGSTEHSIVSKKLDLDYQPLSQLVGLDFPQRTVDFLRKAIAADTDARYREVATFRAGLEDALEALGRSSSVVSPSGAELTSLIDSAEIEVINQDELPTKVGDEEASAPVPEDVPEVVPPPLPPADASTSPPVRSGRVLVFVLLALVAVASAVVVLPFVLSRSEEPQVGVPLLGVATTPTPEPDLGVLAAAADVENVDAVDGADASETDLTTMQFGRISAVTAGKFHSCLALYDGRVRCWGANFDGELGLGHTKTIDTPTAEAWIQFVDGVTQIESAGDRGSSFNCVLSAEGDVRCWGSNNAGQLGFGHTASIGARNNRVGGHGHGSVQLGAVASRVTVGGAQFGSHACALLEGGVIRCWGGNKFGQLGLGHTKTIGDNEQPLREDPVDIGATPRDVIAGKQHTCALVEDGKAVCWGFNREGQLGYGHTDNIGDNEKPSSAGFIDVGGPIRSLAAGRAHTCAILDTTPTGELKCWGWNHQGQLGYGHTDNIGDDESVASVGAVDVGGEVAEVGLGDNHTCARLVDGSVKCWGHNVFGQLGYGHKDPVLSPSDVGAVRLGGVATALYVGSFHNCAILEGDELRCWGYNKYGQLGLGHRRDIGDDEHPDTEPTVVVFDGDEFDQPLTAD